MNPFGKKLIVEIFMRFEGKEEIEEFKQAIDSLLILIKDRQPDCMTDLLLAMKHKLSE